MFASLFLHYTFIICYREIDRWLIGAIVIIRRLINGVLICKLYRKSAHAVIINAVLRPTRLQTTAQITRDWLGAVTLWCIPFDFNNLINFREWSVSEIMT